LTLSKVARTFRRVPESAPVGSYLAPYVNGEEALRPEHARQYGDDEAEDPGDDE